MANAVFDFPYHQIHSRYSESSFRVQFGQGYSFTSKPIAPEQRTFALTFPAMKYYVAANGSIDKVTAPRLNMAVLEQFYQDHQLWKAFDYPHVVLGTLTCRFHEPLEVPKGVAGGMGVLEPFDIKLIEVL